MYRNNPLWSWFHSLNHLSIWFSISTLAWFNWGGSESSLGYMLAQCAVPINYKALTEQLLFNTSVNVFFLSSTPRFYEINLYIGGKKLYSMMSRFERIISKRKLEETC